MSVATIERSWTAHGLECAVLWIDMYGGGHRCGYVRVPVDHPFHGRDYSDTSPLPPVDIEGKPTDDYGMGGAIAALGGRLDEFGGRIEGQIGVHGGLTFSGKCPIDGLTEGWWFGFDCAHLDDTPAHWTEDAVAAEVERMAEQLAAVGVVA